MQNLYEVLGNYETPEERKEKILDYNQEYMESLRKTEEENAYYEFIKDKENGLYSILRSSVINYFEKQFVLHYSNNNYDNCLKSEFLEYFLNKYGFIYATYKNIHNETVEYIQNIATMEDVKKLLDCFYLELQRLDYYNMSKEELWERHQEFYKNNKEWMTKTKIEGHHKRIG